MREVMKGASQLRTHRGRIWQRSGGGGGRRPVENGKPRTPFLKTLEEPPAKSVLVLLTTEPQRILETILLGGAFASISAAKGPSSCLRNKSRGSKRSSDMAALDQKSLLGRYRLMDVLLKTPQ